MQYRLVESYAAGDAAVTIFDDEAGPRTYPVPSLVEDADGVRLLLLDEASSRLRVDTWVRAHAAGAAVLVVVHDECLYSVQLAGQFMGTRRERAREGTMEPVAMRGWTSRTPPTFREVVQEAEGLTRDGVPVAGDSSKPPIDLNEPPPGSSQLEGEFVNLHCHSEMSALDGLATPQEIVAAAVADGQPAAALTDHGVVAGHPDLQKACDAAGIRPVFGVEIYLVDDRSSRTVVKGEKQYWHVCLWALDDEGLRNLWAISTEGYREGFYYKPRVDWDTLERLGGGIAASTGCLGGPVSQALLAGDEILARTRLARMLDIFGDRLYVEVQTNHLPEQVAVNPDLVRLAREFRVPLLAAADSHYATRDQAQTHRAWLGMATNNKITEDSGMFGGGQEYHCHTAAEVRDALAYLGEDVVAEAMASTVALADRCTARVAGALKKPVYSRDADHAAAVRRDGERLLDMCMESWARKVVGKERPAAEYEDRMVRELRLILDRELAGFYLVTADLVREAKCRGILTSPCRGSGGASLVAYLTDITEVDPVQYELPFERFLTEERVEMPDFDIDFPSSKRAEMTAYLVERWGPRHVVRIGSHLRLRVREAVNKCRKVLEPVLDEGKGAYADYVLYTAAVEAAEAPMAGQHISWDDLWEQFGDVLEPLRRAHSEVFDLAGQVVGRLRGYGKHASGIVISTDDPLDYLPMRRDDDQGALSTQFDFRQLDELGYLKYDFLTLTTLDVIQRTVDLIEAEHGRRLDIYGWREEYDDPMVWDELCAGRTAGVFQFDTHAGTRLIKQLRPRSIRDLADVTTLVRPGPSKAGITDAYVRRRAGLEAVSYVDPRMELVTADTQGLVIYQEQVMAAAMVLAGYGAGEADTKVRKPLGKKLTGDKTRLMGEELVRRAVDYGTDREVIETLWEQLKEFSKYAFGKSHAVGYAILAHWTKWLGVHFPAQFLAATLSEVKVEKVPGFISEARRLGLRVLPPDINASGPDWTPQGDAILYGLETIKGVGAAAVAPVMAARPFASWEDFDARVLSVQGVKFNAGHARILASVGAFDSIHPNRRALEVGLEQAAEGADRRCVHKDAAATNPTSGLPCGYDWTTEPDPPLVSSGRGKLKVYVAKPPPKACTVACRAYTPPPPLDPASVEPWTAEDVREREREVLGVHLSSRPFDRLDPADRARLHKVADVEEGPEGEYVVAALVAGVSSKTDRSGRPFAFVELEGEDGKIRAVCFADRYAVYRGDLRPDRLVLAVLRKTDRGCQLVEMATTK